MGSPTEVQQGPYHPTRELPMLPQACCSCKPQRRISSGTLGSGCLWLPFHFQNADNYYLSLDGFFALGFSFSSRETESFCDQTGTWTCSQPTNTAAANTAATALGSQPDPAARACPCWVSPVLQCLEVGQFAHGKSDHLPPSCSHCPYVELAIMKFGAIPSSPPSHHSFPAALRVLFYRMLCLTAALPKHPRTLHPSPQRFSHVRSHHRYPSAAGCGSRALPRDTDACCGQAPTRVVQLPRSMGRQWGRCPHYQSLLSALSTCPFPEQGNAWP